MVFKKSTVKKAVGLVLMGLAFAFPQQGLAGSQTTVDAKIKIVTTGVNTKWITVFLQDSNHHVNPANCGSGDRIVLYMDGDLAPNVYRAILGAKLADSKVRFAVYDDRCVENSSGKSFPQMVNIQVK